MTQRDYLTLADALELHSREVERHGGAHGVRDMGALESALFRPQSGYYDDIVWESCALMESIAVNHPFLDGNKRAAFAATYTFLAINGWSLSANVEETYAFISGLYESKQFNFSPLAQWLRANVSRATAADGSFSGSVS